MKSVQSVPSVVWSLNYIMPQFPQQPILRYRILSGQGFYFGDLTLFGYVKSSKLYFSSLTPMEICIGWTHDITEKIKHDGTGFSCCCLGTNCLNVFRNFGLIF